MTVHPQEVTIYVGVDIGCIECGEESKMVAINTDEAKVRGALEAAERRQAADWHGEHHFECFSAPVTLKIPVEFA